jgi:hypothetical protein
MPTRTNRLADLLWSERPRALCDHCLAIEVDIPLDEAHAAARYLAGQTGFSRVVQTCSRCRRTVELTAVA